MHQIDPARPLTLAAIARHMNSGEKIALSPNARRLICDCRAFLEQKLAASDRPFYGINTGFGSLVSVKIAPNQLADLCALCIDRAGPR